jgi:5-methylcytosine-specific restriction endonuclease McrA
MESLIFQKKIICSDCGLETIAVVARQKRCAACRLVIEAAWDRAAKRKWKKKSVAAGTHCSRCHVRFDGSGVCNKCRSYVSAWKKASGYRSPGNVLRVSSARQVRADCKSLLLKQRGCCAACGGDEGPWHLDHVMPLCLGGADDLENLQVLCAPCNLRKGRKDPIDFARSIGRLL